MENKALKRQSGIELYKIIAMLIIVTIHTVQTIGQNSVDYPVYNANVINLAQVTDNIQYFIMALIWNFGFYGVNVFFVSSAWFLRDSKGIKKGSVLKLILNVWVISMIFLIVYVLTGVPLKGEMIVKSFLPTLFANNWFITCYIFMYIFHPIFNKVCDNLSGKSHLLIVLGGLVYSSVTTLSEYMLFYSKLIIVMIIYFTVAYVKKYMPAACDDRRLNRCLFFAAFALDVLIICLINLLGHKMGFLSNQLMHMQVLENPLFLIMAISGFNLFKGMKFTSGAVNYISGLTLYIYIIHENLLFRTYTRPAIWNLLLGRFGYDRILLCLLIFVAALFTGSMVLSALYGATIQKLTDRLAINLSDRLKSGADKVYERIITHEEKSDL